MRSLEMKIFVKLLRDTCAGVSLFLTSLQFYEKRGSGTLYRCEFLEIFQTKFFTELFLGTVSSVFKVYNEDARMTR